MRIAYLSDTTCQMRSYRILSSPPAHLRMWQAYDIKVTLQDGIVTTFDRSHQPRPTAWLSASKIERDLAFLHALGRLLPGTKGASRPLAVVRERRYWLETTCHGWGRNASYQIAMRALL
jgi:hypothetical protein